MKAHRLNTSALVPVSAGFRESLGNTSYGVCFLTPDHIIFSILFFIKPGERPSLFDIVRNCVEKDFFLSVVAWWTML